MVFRSAVDLEQSAQISRSDIQNERRDYKMPPVREGMQVVWYRYNHPDNRGQVGTVVRVSERQRHVDINVPFDAQGENKETVYHITDPILKLGRESIEGGCWEYTDDFKYQRKSVADLEGRLGDIEKKFYNSSSTKLEKRVEKLEVALKRLQVPDVE